MGHRTRVRDAQISAAVASSRSIAEALRALGLQPLGGNYQTIHSAVARLGLDTRHWTGQGHRKGANWPTVPAKSLAEILVKGRPYKTSLLRQRLLSEGLMERICSSCSLATWQQRAMPLELDHIDGDRTNNELSNLRLLCPNCHALTPTYRGRNKGRQCRNSDNMPAGPDGGMVYAGDLRKLSARVETRVMDPVKLGEGPAQTCERTPSQALDEKHGGRCREQTAGA